MSLFVNSVPVLRWEGVATHTTDKLVGLHIRMFPSLVAQHVGQNLKCFATLLKITDVLVVPPLDMSVQFLHVPTDPVAQSAWDTGLFRTMR